MLLIRYSGRIRETRMNKATPKLAKAMTSLWREENQQVIEFFLLMALITLATGMGGLGVVSRVDAAFRNIGSTFSTYVK